MKRKLRRVQRLTFALLDISTIIIAQYVSYWLSRHWVIIKSNRLDVIPPEKFLPLVIFTTFTILIFLFWQGVYRPNVNHLKLESNRRLVRAMVIMVAVIFIPYFFQQHWVDTRELLVIMIIIVPLFLGIQKSLVGAILSKTFDKPVSRKNLVIIGIEIEPSVLLRSSLANWDPGYNPVGFLAKSNSDLKEISTESLGVKGSAKILGDYSRLEHTIKEHNVDVIWLNDPYLSEGELDQIHSLCDSYNLELCVAPAVGKIPSVAIEAFKVGGQQVLLREMKINRRPFYNTTKRFLDLITAGIAFLVLSPLYFIIAIFIKMDSKGPVIFKQIRIGKDGKPFMMYKFRSMKVGSPKYAEAANDKTDPRITKIGRFLRKTSLDEMPQLLNVLNGSMSLVGPRPEMEFIVKEYNSYQRLRLAIKPGITGLWQISADRRIPIHQNMDYDINYILNRSFLTDLIILWRTVWTAINGL